METPPAGALTASAVVFAATYFVMLVGRAHRATVALAGAVAMIAVGSWFSFYDMHTAGGAVDFNTIFLLLGMMIVVELFRETGFFQYLAIAAAKLTRGRPWLLLIYLGLVTSLISMVLDNVTTILILVPVTVSIADIMGISPLPFLIGELVLSNVGGVATLIGDPPNILIGSAAGYSFTDFLVHLAPIVVVAWIAAQGFLLLIFRKSLRGTPESVARLLSMNARLALTDRRTAYRMLTVLIGTIILFLIHDRVGLEPGVVALAGASVGLLWIRPSLETILKAIHWDVLLFFIALFMIVGGLEAGGLLGSLGRGIESLVGIGMPVAVLAVLWGSALASGVLSNVPFTIAMLPVLKGLATHGVAVGPLWWALALGVGLGANLTPIGAASNVLVSSLSETIGTPLGPRAWLRTGSVVAVLTCVVGSGGILLALACGWL
ncbi:MAG: ArsB/NhaD family transporter [Candidatus Bipolaricaulota bacterium]|nr:MAG: ArsB/NhaD family transporter [Candidatus Bipolaricaulota bacterium]